MAERNFYTLADEMMPIPHAVGIMGAPLIDLGMQRRVFQLSAHLASANQEVLSLRKRIQELEAQLSRSPTGEGCNG